MGADRYVRFHYDNDFFTAIDLDYTQGYTFEIALPWLIKNPVNYILIKPVAATSKYVLSFEQTGFTPADITAPEILYGDRPYAATIALKSAVIATDTVRKSRLTTSFTAGMTGPAAFGNEMQTGIHKWIDDDLPQGWTHQIRNDVIADYELAFEKQLLDAGNIMLLSSYTKLRAGTLATNAATGVTLVAGLFDSPFGALKASRNFQAYAYTQAAATIVGYDATLQGGIFNNSSPYTITPGDMERFTLQNHFGIILRYKALYLEYSRAMLSREYKAGHSHKWGGFRIGFTI